jgi:hypothetical protein
MPHFADDDSPPRDWRTGGRGGGGTSPVSGANLAVPFQLPVAPVGHTHYSTSALPSAPRPLARRHPLRKQRWHPACWMPTGGAAAAFTAPDQVKLWPCVGRSVVRIRPCGRHRILTEGAWSRAPQPYRGKMLAGRMASLSHHSAELQGGAWLRAAMKGLADKTQVQAVGC